MVLARPASDLVIGCIKTQTIHFAVVEQLRLLEVSDLPTLRIQFKCLANSKRVLGLYLSIDFFWLRDLYLLGNHRLVSSLCLLLSHESLVEEHPCWIALGGSSLD